MKTSFIVGSVPLTNELATEVARILYHGSNVVAEVRDISSTNKFVSTVYKL